MKDDIVPRLVRILARKFAGATMPEDDLVQEGMLALMKAQNTFDEKKEIKFETYASRVITNRFIDLLRKQGEKVQEYTEDMAQGSTSIDDEVNLIEIKKTLANHVDDIDRAIFTSYIEGFSYDEIGKIFDRSKKNIDNTVQKVKKIIKSHVS